SLEDIPRLNPSKSNTYTVKNSSFKKRSSIKLKVPYIVTTSRYVVPTGRVKVPAGRYVVPTGKDNVIVSAGRTKVIPAGRTILVLVVLCLLRVDSVIILYNPLYRLEDLSRAGPTKWYYEHDVAHEVLEYWIMNSDHNLWNIVLNGNSRKKTGRDPKGNIMILPPVSGKEHIVVQREKKARTILLQSLPEDHMADFHHLDDARDIWLAVKARFGGNDESKKMRKSMLKKEFLEFRVSESEGLHKGVVDKFKMIIEFHLIRCKARQKNGRLVAQVMIKSPTASSNVMENVLHSFVAESDPQQQITYEDFDQIGKLDLEELDIKWQMAMLSVRINRFEKKAGRKMKFNNKDAARFDKKKVKCYKCSELGHFARECTGKQLDSKARYSSFKLKELDKTEEPKALLSVDSMLNWSDHEGEDVENGAAQVYGMIAGAEEDATGGATGNATGDVADDVSTAAAEFALMGISSQVQTCPFGCEHLYAELKKEFDNVEAQYKESYIQVQAYKSTLQTLEQQKGWYQSNQLALEERIRILTANLENTTNMLKYSEKLNEQGKLEKLNDKVQLKETKARFDKWKDSSKKLDKLIHSSMSSRSKFGLGFDTTPEDVAEKPLYDRFVKAVGMHAVPPPITGTFMPPSNNPDLDDTQFTYGSKSNNYVETNSVSNDFVSCDNSDKSSDSETTDFASCVSSVKSSSSKTNEPLASAPSSVDFKTVSETADQQSNSTNDDSSFSFKENVKPPRNLCNKSRINSRSLCKRKSFGSKTCFVCGSKFHLIKDCDFYEKQLELHNKPMTRPASVPTGSRNRSTSVPAGRPFFAEAARTMLADSKLPTMFWTEAVSTACYVLNRVLVTKPHNKTPYELVSGKVPNISHLKPFGCLVTILNTSDYLGKFKGKADEGFIVGYAAYSKAYWVYNLSIKNIKETLNLRYLEDKPNVQGLGHEWYFDLDYLTDSLGYTRFKTNQPAGTQDTIIHAGTQADSDSNCDEQVVVVPSFPSNSFLGIKVNEASDMVERSLDYAEELARLQKQAFDANTTAEKHLSQADLAASRNRVPAGRVDTAAGVSVDPSTPVFKPIHTAAPSLPPGHSLGSSEHSTIYPSLSDLANSMSSYSGIEDIYHHPNSGIFSSSSYDD
ncbi:putative ribonuclease H-like domain-containing protein, partial [Tanacetum coccineum]